MVNRILLSSFDSNLIVTIKNTFYNTGNICVAASYVPQRADIPSSFQQDLHWLHADSTDKEYGEVFSEISAVVVLASTVGLTEIVRLAVRFNRPLIFCSTHIPEYSLMILERAASYIPIMAYYYKQDTLFGITQQIEACVVEVKNAKITGKIIQKSA